MVVVHNIQDIFEVSAKASVLCLPNYKENSLKIEFEEADVSETDYNGPKPPLPFAASEVFFANISDWRLLTAKDEDCKPVYEVTFDVRDSNFKFKSGDTIGILPRNSDTEVDVILDHLNLASQADLTYTLKVDNNTKGAKIPPHIPVKSTLRYVLTHCIDLRSVVKKLSLLVLSKYTRNENEKKALEYLCSKEGSVAYTTHILNKNMCILGLFNTFKTCKPPIEVLLGICPRLLPRPYSIVNSGIKDPNIIKICFSVMNLSNNRKGITTGWLEKLILEEGFNIEDGIKNLSIKSIKQSRDYKVPIYIRKNLNGFTLPDLKTSLLLIGPGTGVAPFIGFLEERQLLKENIIEIGDVWLFFGCRNPNIDFIYEKELKEFVCNGTLNRLDTSFSRIEKNGGIKYVQDALLQNFQEISKLLQSDVTIFVCGNLKTMAVQVREALIECLVRDGKSQDEAELLVTNLEKEKRYLTDIWS